VAAFYLAIRQKRAHAVCIEVIDLEVIVDIPTLGRNRAAADSDAAQRRLVAHGPGDLVGAVHGCSIRLSPHSQTKLYQLRICHSTSLIPSGRVLAGGIVLTGSYSTLR